MTFLKSRCLYLYIRISGTRINQSDATLLCNLTNKMQLYSMTYMWFKTVYSHQTATVVLAVVVLVFFFDNLMENESVPLTKQSGML